MSIDIPSKRHETKTEIFPKVFMIVERVLRYVKENKGSLKSALCSIVPKELMDRVCSIIYNVMKHKEIIGAVLKDTKLLEKVPLRQEAVEIMIYEMGIRKSSLPGESEGVLIMRKYKTEIDDAFRKLCDDKHPMANASNTYRFLPKYVKIHTRAISVDDALADLECNGYERIHYPSDIFLKDYNTLVLDLQIKQFLVDYHFKDLLVFAYDDNPFKLEMFKKRQLVWENKSSYVLVHELSPEPGSVVIAASCSRTPQLVSVMENKGTIYTIFKCPKLCDRLRSKLDMNGSKISQVLCEDFKDVNPYAHPYYSAKYILLEPESSKSGMVLHNTKLANKNNATSKEQLHRLSCDQIEQLKHALSFPQVERVVYSTCSITEEENEFVVSEVFKLYSHKFRLIPAMPEWPERGLQGYEHKDMFFRAMAQERITNTTFVAVFERVVPTEDVGAIRDASCEAFTPEDANEEMVNQSGLKKRKMLKKNSLSKSTGKVSGRPTSIVRKKKKVEKA